MFDVAHCLGAFVNVEDVTCLLSGFVPYTRISGKLMDTRTCPKRPVCSLLKTYLNSKKIPSVSPIYHNKNLITDFKEKVELFSQFFAKHCTLVDNPTLHKKWSFPLRISSVNVTKPIGNCGFGHIDWRNP